MNLLQRTLIAGAALAALYAFHVAVVCGAFGPDFRKGYLIGFGVTPARSATVIASTYAPCDGIVRCDDYGTSSGERYDPKALTCAAPKSIPLGTKLHLTHGRCNEDVTINDRFFGFKGRGLDCSTEVGKRLCLNGLGKVLVQPYPPLPKARPSEAP